MYRGFYTDAFTHKHIKSAHKNLCTQHVFTHNQLLDREALLPLLDHLRFVFPPEPFKYVDTYEAT